MKFGGSSLGTGERIVHVAEIINTFSKEDDVVIVVSAIHKVTDILISIFKKYQNGNIQEASNDLRLLYDTHNRALIAIGLDKKDSFSVDTSLLDLFSKLSVYLGNISDFSPQEYDYVISFGERFASLILSAALNKIGIKSEPINSSYVIVADNTFGNARANIEETKIAAKQSLLPLLANKTIPVVTGFFAATKEGEVVTLGRGGSDYSATIIAHVLDAHEVILWKEVDGVYSDDPKKDAQAKFYSDLSYEEALYLAEKGAKILHPEAMKPVAAKGIVVRVKNTFKPSFRGTKIWKGSLA